MKTYFVCSDIHGFYDQWMISLNEAGFDQNNKEHILIVLGDIFDRGQKPLEIYTFLKSLPQDRLILVKGNHEYLLLDLVRRNYPLEHDVHNGTYDTIVSLYKDPFLVRQQFILENKDTMDDSTLTIKAREIYLNETKKLYNNPKLNEIIEWIKSPKWLNYYELGTYIFVHSFIPLRGKDSVYRIDDLGEYDPNWRESSTGLMWEYSTWGCPFVEYAAGRFKEEEKKGKVLVCGHWHTADFYNKLLYKDDASKQLNFRKENPIFKSQEFPGLIGIDACTAATKKVNVLVIKESEI